MHGGHRIGLSVKIIKPATNNNTSGDDVEMTGQGDTEAFLRRHATVHTPCTMLVLVAMRLVVGLL